MCPLLSSLVDLALPLQAPFLLVSLAIQSHPHQSDLRAETWHIWRIYIPWHMWLMFV